MEVSGSIKTTMSIPRFSFNVSDIVIINNYVIKMLRFHEFFMTSMNMYVCSSTGVFFASHSVILNENKFNYVVVRALSAQVIFWSFQIIMLKEIRQNHRSN